MTNSQTLAPARTTDAARRGTTPATTQRQSSEPDIKALWAPLLQLLNGSPTGYAPSR
jgi:predicted component of type VI protein secretion system